MIQTLGKLFHQWNSITITKAHGSNPRQIIYQKAQFSLATSKGQVLIDNIKNPIPIGKIKSPVLTSAHWQHQNPNYH